MDKKKLEAAVIKKIKEMSNGASLASKELELDGAADANIRHQARSAAITILKLDDHEFVGESPYPSQNKTFVNWAKGQKYVASASITKTGRSSRSSDGNDYPIEQVVLKFK